MGRLYNGGAAMPAERAAAFVKPRLGFGFGWFAYPGCAARSVGFGAERRRRLDCVGSIIEREGVRISFARQAIFCAEFFRNFAGWPVAAGFDIGEALADCFMHFGLFFRRGMFEPPEVEEFFQSFRLAGVNFLMSELLESRELIEGCGHRCIVNQG